MEKSKPHHHKRSNGKNNTAHNTTSSSSSLPSSSSPSSNRPIPKPVQASSSAYGNSTASSLSSSSSSTDMIGASDSDSAGSNIPRRTTVNYGGHPLLETSYSSSPSSPLSESRPGAAGAGAALTSVSSPLPSSSSIITRSPPRNTYDSPPLATTPTYAIICLRCHQEPDGSPFAPLRTEMVSFGTNMHYCRRCAKTVGYIR